MQAMSDVLNTNDTIMERAENDGNSATKMANQITKLSEKMAETVTEEKRVEVSTQNIAALIMKVPKFILNPDEKKNDTTDTGTGMWVYLVVTNLV